MKELKNPKHEVFCQALIKNNNNQVAAYKEAYGNKNSAKSNATRLMDNEGIIERLKALRADISKENKIDINNVLQFADRIRLACMGSEAIVCEDTGETIKQEVKADFVNALKANEQVGRIIGAFTDKLILEKPKTIEQLLAASKGNQNGK